MGYNTDWNGVLNLSRELTPSEQQEWETIRNERHDSQYNYGDERREFPSMWCGFEVSGDCFSWDGGEKTYEGVGWIKFFIDKLKEWSKNESIYAWGEMEWDGEESDDIGKVVVEFATNTGEQIVKVQQGSIMYDSNLWVLDYEQGEVFNYDTPMVDADDIEEMLTEKGHNLTNCNWMLKS
jgi:hypothetical protein|tara:strand:+ start:1766 stop:2305 length:540 start_codon:yes stop_codon:yes gene_type:complete